MSLTIPTDEPAEAEVVGGAVASPVGYRLAAAVVEPGDFYVPRFGRAFAACAGLDGVPRGWDSGARISAVAELAVIDAQELRRLVDERSLFHDVPAQFAHRVADAARRRRAMAALAQAYNALGAGAPLEEATLLIGDSGGIAARRAA